MSGNDGERVDPFSGSDASSQSDPAGTSEDKGQDLYRLAGPEDFLNYVSGAFSKWVRIPQARPSRTDSDPPSGRIK